MRGSSRRGRSRFAGCALGQLRRNHAGEDLVLRGGVRQTFGTTALDWTPYAPTLISGSTNYQVTTWMAGGTFQATDWLGFRAGASTGFRAGFSA